MWVSHFYWYVTWFLSMSLAHYHVTRNICIQFALLNSRKNGTTSTIWLHGHDTLVKKYNAITLVWTEMKWQVWIDDDIDDTQTSNVVLPLPHNARVTQHTSHAVINNAKAEVMWQDGSVCHSSQSTHHKSFRGLFYESHDQPIASKVTARSSRPTCKNWVIAGHAHTYFVWRWWLGWASKPRVCAWPTIT